MNIETSKCRSVIKNVLICTTLASLSCVTLASNDLGVGDFLYGMEGKGIENELQELSYMGGDLDNYSEVNITNATLSRATIVQNSRGVEAGNKAKVTQQGYRNGAKVTQQGRANIAIVRQSGVGNRAEIASYGVGNEAVIVQEGHLNRAAIGQVSLGGSSISVNQEGVGNVALVGRVGAADIGINQTGGDSIFISPASNINIQVNQ
ncbi:curlin subunit CsgB [Vibrio variabilis]|uniref:curlin subunit CsgB n=1 Tax=Vibrio variabilis TaxID=990271 RepID=UPI0013A6A7D2|nr:curlin subunit CsgB [Vibrio variabilis]